MPSDNSIHVRFELAPRNPKYFRERLKRSRASPAEEDEEPVISSAAGLVKDALAAESPKFVKSRLGNLGRLISMVTDPHWRLEGRDRARVLDALAYFADLEDLIPDRILGIRMRRRPRSGVQRLRSSSRKSSLRLW